MNKTLFDFSDMQDERNVFHITCVAAWFVILTNFIVYFVDAFFISGIAEYMTAHHFINYKFGLLPRALYGATVGELTQILPKAAYFLIWFLICLFPFVMYFLIYLHARKKCCNTGVLDAIAVFALILPTTFLPLNDFFRLDIVLLNWFVLCAWVIWKKHWLRFGVPFVMIIMTLTHEAAIFMFLPTLCGITLFKAEKKSDIVLLALLFLGVVSSCITYLFCAKIPVDVQAIDAFLQSRNTMESLVKGDTPITLAPHYKSVEAGYIQYTLSHFSAVWLMRVLFSIPFYAITVYIIYRIWRAVYNSNQARNFRLKLIFLFVSTLSNICLFIGCDYNRWMWAWFSVHILLLFFLLGDNNVNKMEAFSLKQKRRFLVVLFVFLISGTGTCHSFSKLTDSCATAVGFTISKIFHRCMNF